MMKYFLAISLFISQQAFSQGFQAGRYTITINTATMQVSESKLNGGDSFHQYNVTNEQGALLLSVVNRFFFYFNAVPTFAANFSQEATSGSWIISTPSTPTTTKAIFMPDKQTAIVFNGAQYGFAWEPPNPFPLEIRALVNGKPTGTLKCTIGADGNILWPDISGRTAAAISTTGLVQYTLQ